MKIICPACKTEDVEFNWGEVKSSNFSDYQIPLFSMIPETIETSLADAMDQPPQGVMVLT